MGSKTTLFCDWCTAETETEDVPVEWKVVTLTGLLLCGACCKARDEALRGAKAHRLATQTNRSVNINDVTAE